MKGFGRKSVSTRNFPKLPTLVTPGIYLFMFQRDMGCRSAATLVFLLPPKNREGEKIIREGDFLKREDNCSEQIVSRRKS